MKKIYVKPQTEVTKIEMQSMIASSAAGSTVYEIEAESEAIGFSRKGGSLWDDEEE